MGALQKWLQNQQDFLQSAQAGCFSFAVEQSTAIWYDKYQKQRKQLPE